MKNLKIVFKKSEKSMKNLKIVFKKSVTCYFVYFGQIMSIYILINALYDNEKMGHMATSLTDEKYFQRYVLAWLLPCQCQQLLSDFGKIILKVI
jgi:hypothetical protein